MRFIPNQPLSPSAKVFENLVPFIGRINREIIKKTGFSGMLMRLIKTALSDQISRITFER